MLQGRVLQQLHFSGRNAAAFVRIRLVIRVTM